MDLIGCEPEELKKHLENLFVDGMTFENYGEWEIDHCKPISSFDLTEIEEVKKCFNYKNLQPLWMHDNRVKRSKIKSRNIIDVDGYKICVDFVDDDNDVDGVVDI
jgi:hypothetical protein